MTTVTDALAGQAAVADPPALPVCPLCHHGIADGAKLILVAIACDSQDDAVDGDMPLRYHAMPAHRRCAIAISRGLANVAAWGQP